MIFQKDINAFIFQKNYELGKLNTKVVCSSFGFKKILPPCASIILRVNVSPIPEPSFLVVKYGIKICSLIFSAIPIPLSIKNTLVLLSFDIILISNRGVILFTNA